MSATLGVLSPPPDAIRGRRDFPLSEEEQVHLERLIQQMEEVLLPLLSVRTPGQLERLLRENARSYLHLRNELWGLVAGSLDTAAVVSLVHEIYGQLTTRVQEDTKVLSSADREILVGILGSVQGLFDAAVQTSGAEQARLVDIMMECGDALQRADMCFSAVLFVLSGEITQWELGAIRLLCRNADRYMLDVEDVFLAHDKKIHERLKSESQTIPLEEVKRRIGLSS